MNVCIIDMEGKQVHLGDRVAYSTTNGMLVGTLISFKAYLTYGKNTRFSMRIRCDYTSNGRPKHSWLADRTVFDTKKLLKIQPNEPLF